jgi:DNA-3-methyladenine glycosylase
VAREAELTSGPGKLCMALGIDLSFDGADLLGDRVWIEAGPPVPPARVASGPRVGIAYAEGWVETPWRFWIRGDPNVSRPEPRARQEPGHGAVRRPPVKKGGTGGFGV